MRSSIFIPVLVLAALVVGDAAADDRSVCGTAYEAAQRSRIAGHVGAAREELLLCVREVCPGFIRTDCVTWLAEVEAAQPTVVYAVMGPDGHDLTGATIDVDGRVLSSGADGGEHPIDPGPHTIRMQYRDEIIVQKIVIRSGEKRRLVEFHVARTIGALSTRPVPASVYVAGGASLGFLTTAATFWAVGRSSASQYNAGCEGAAGCSASDRNVVRRELLFGDIAFLVSAGAGALATYLFFTRPEVNPRSPSP